MQINVPAKSTAKNGEFQIATEMIDPDEIRVTLQSLQRLYERTHSRTIKAVVDDAYTTVSSLAVVD